MDHLLEAVHALATCDGGECRARTGVGIAATHGHAAPCQALRHVCAHPPQSYHAYVQCHLGRPNVEGAMLQEALPPAPCLTDPAHRASHGPSSRARARAM